MKKYILAHQPDWLGVLSKMTMMMIILVGLTNCANWGQSALPQSEPYSSAANNTSHSSIWESNNATIWNNLHHLSTTRLAKLKAAEQHDPNKSGWIELALISKKNRVNTSHLTTELIAWRLRFPTHPANELLPKDPALKQLLSPTTPQHIAILLPQTGTYQSAGQSVRDGFLHAYQANLSNLGKQNIKFYDTNQSTNLASLYQQVIAEGADFIVGPLTKEEVMRLSNSTSFKIPTLALNYSTPSHRSASNLYEYGLLPEDEANQMADRAREAGHFRAIVIAPQNGWGKRMVSTFKARWGALGGRIQDTWFYSSNLNFSQNIASLLHVNPEKNNEMISAGSTKSLLAQQGRHDFDIILLFSQPKDAQMIVSLLRNSNAKNISIYANSSVFTGNYTGLKGVTVCDIPWVKQRATQTNLSSDRLYAVGQDAYLLSQTLERLKQLPHFPIYGATGALTLSSNHQIHRRLPCNVIHDGRL